VPLFALPVGQPADRERIGRLEQADAVTEVQAGARVEFAGDVEKAG
jgi:hypothetical protein